jgi:hypothetical protein
MPAEVGERLDRALAGLTRDEPGAPGVAPVVDLAARRRRRNAAAVLAGAAAVIVAGFAVGQGIDVGSDDAGSASSNSAADAERSTASDEAARSPGIRGQGGGQAANPSESVPAPTSSPELLRLRSAHLQHDLRTQLGALRDTADSVRNPAQDFAALGCEPAPASEFGAGELFPALLDGQPAVVALRPAVDGRQQADVLACDSAATLATASLPAH